MSEPPTNAAPQPAPRLALAPLFAAVGRALQHEQAALNQADGYNGDHGDHMAAIFDVAAQAAAEQEGRPLGEAMHYAAERLEALPGNGSAAVYAQGLRLLAEQFRRYNLEVDDLAGYVRHTLAEDAPTGTSPALRSGDVLKALVNGLSAWSQSPPPGEAPAAPAPALSMGSLFEFGMAYLHAKQRGGSKREIIADAAASVSPLNRLPHRYQSARLAIAAFLEALQAE